MNSFYFIRHGQTDWNLEGRLQGNTDVALNKTGKWQAQQAATQLEHVNFQNIISSPLIRAFDTAKIIHQLQPAAQLSTHAGLRERSFGIFEGQIRQQVLEELKLSREEFAAQKPPKGESPEECLARTLSALEEIHKSAQGNFLVVSHGGVFRRLHEHFVGTGAECDNATTYHFSLQNGTWRCEKLAQPATTAQQAS